MRVLVPKSLQPRVLEMLHEGHIGIVRVKQVARSHVWWPCIDKDVEQLVRSCKSCQQDQKALVAAHYTPGFGRPSHGPGYTWILQDLLWVKPF